MKQCMLTTNDNPFNPFDQFDEWLAFDNAKGYNSSGRLMRVAKLNDAMSDTEENAEIERAIDVIIEHDFLNIFKKATKELTYPEEEHT